MNNENMIQCSSCSGFGVQYEPGGDIKCAPDFPCQKCNGTGKIPNPLNEELECLNVLTNRAEQALQRIAHRYGKDIDCDRCFFSNNCSKININCEEKIYDWAYDVSKNV